MGYTNNNMVKAIRKAQEYFGLSNEDLTTIQLINDDHDNLDDRHTALRKRIESWTEEE